MDRRVRAAIALIKATKYPATTVEEIASRVNLSPSHLNRLFKAEIGVTLSQYIKDLRLEGAMELLKENPFLKWSQIVATVGATHAGHLEEDFKKRYGRSHNEYRLEFSAPDLLKGPPDTA